MLDWALNTADDDLLAGGRQLTPPECDLLIPARDTRGGARRLVLLISVADGRRHGRFNAQDGIARVRFRIRNDRVYLNIRTPTRSEPLDYEPDALALLHELKAKTQFKLIPAFRDAGSARFQETLTAALEGKLRERAVHQAQGGAPGEYRLVSGALRTITDVADALVQPLWGDMQHGVLGLAREGALHLDAEAGDLVEWMASRIRFRLVTGDHDTRAVAPIEVGSGLQSLLDLAVLRGEQPEEGIETILAVEEPEAFLHPSAQRTLARALLERDGVKRIISTHSPALVDEASYGDVVLVRDHRIFPPRESTDERRREINSALMSGQGAEAMFARAIMLVEGHGDKLFFESLRRRVAHNDPSHRADELAVVHVGSNAAFSPWIRLFESYLDPSTGERPVEWLLVADGIDAPTEIARALRDAGITIPADVDAVLRVVQRANTAGDDNGSIEATRLLNELAAAAGLRVSLVPIDLEWCALQNASRNTLNDLAVLLVLPEDDRAGFLSRLGSKHGGGSIAQPRKEPWMRGAIAQTLPWSEVSRDAKSLMKRWLLAGGIQTGAADEILRRA